MQPKNVGEKDEILIKAITTDESLKILGELLSNESSRSIIKALINCEMYANEITKKLELRSNLVAHHLRKMESIGLLEVTRKRIIRKGREHRHFRIPSGLLVLPGTQKEDEGGFLKKVLRGCVKFVAIGIAGLVPLAFQIADVPTDSGADYDSDSGMSLPNALVASLTIVVIGLIIERIYVYRKK